jgi:hypothetical protein
MDMRLSRSAAVLTILALSVVLPACGSKSSDGHAISDVSQAAMRIYEDTGHFPPSGAVTVAESPDGTRPAGVDPSPWDNYLSRSPQCGQGLGVRFEVLKPATGFRILCGTSVVTFPNMVRGQK